MKKYLIVLLSAVMIISCTVVLAACNSTDNNKPNTPNIPQEQTQQLTTPSNLTLNNTMVSWAAVSNANGYTVRVGTAEHQVASGTTFDLSSLTLAEGTYQISVKAVGQTVGNIRYTDSAYSSSVDYVVKATVKEGHYRLTSITFDGKTYDATKADDIRAFFKATTAKAMIEYLQSIYPWFNFNDLTTLKLLFAGELDFTGITTAEQFWDAYIEYLISTDEDMADSLNGSIELTNYGLEVTNNTILAYSNSGVSLPVAFTLNNGVITLANPALLGGTDSVFTYANGVITETASDSTFDFLVVVFVYELTVR